MGSTSTTTTTTTTCLSISFFILFSLLSSSFSTTDAAIFDIRNQCPYPVWAAAIPVGGGRRLGPGESWQLNVGGGTSGRIWGRTNCNFDGNGNGRCQTGDCGGVRECRLSGAIPATLAEYTTGGAQDFFDISLVDGFNLPMAFNGCQSITCSADINSQCPNEVRVPGGCRNPRPPGNNGPTDISRFFKQRCPTSYTYPTDDLATKACPAGTNYRVVFCP